MLQTVLNAVQIVHFNDTVIIIIIIIIMCNLGSDWELVFPSKVRVSNQNGVSLLYIMLEIHHSGW